MFQQANAKCEDWAILDQSTSILQFHDLPGDNLLEMYGWRSNDAFRSLLMNEMSSVLHAFVSCLERRMTLIKIRQEPDKTWHTRPLKQLSRSVRAAPSFCKLGNFGTLILRTRK